MEQTAKPASVGAPNTVEIVVHVTEALDEDQRNSLVSALNGTTGIADAVFCPLRYHLMLVRYNRDLCSSQDVLGSITSHDVQAQLIGPV